MNDETRTVCKQALNYAEESHQCADMQKAVCMSLTALIDCQHKQAERQKEMSKTLESWLNQKKGVMLAVQVFKYLVAVGGGAWLVKILEVI